MALQNSARLEPHVNSGQIYVTEDFVRHFEEDRGKHLPFDFARLGPEDLKNLPLDGWSFRYRQGRRGRGDPCGNPSGRFSLRLSEPLSLAVCWSQLRLVGHCPAGLSLLRSAVGRGPVAREQRKLAAIVAADVVGYSRLMGRDESGTLAR